MDIQLDELLNKIKEEGVKTAEDEAEKIIEAAKKEASLIEKQAREKGDKIKEDGRRHAQKLEDDAIESIRIQSRDLLLKLKNQIKDLFDKVVFEETGKILTEDAIKEIIVAIFKTWDSHEIPNLKLLLTPEKFKKLGDYLKDRLSTHIRAGLVIQPDPDLDAGFKISVKDGSLYYDFTVGGISKIISQGLSPGLAEILNKSIQEK